MFSLGFMVSGYVSTHFQVIASRPNAGMVSGNTPLSHSADSPGIWECRYRFRELI